MDQWFESTLCFRKFRNRHSELSDIYWFHSLGVDSIIKTIDGIDDNIRCDTVFSLSFSLDKLPENIGKLRDKLKTYLDRSRLNLLVVCAANLEQYLKDVTYLYLLAKGYRKSWTKLNEIGEAMGSPILDKASLPEPLKYAEKLFNVHYGENLIK